jgi:hypothetical protein
MVVLASWSARLALVWAMAPAALAQTAPQGPARPILYPTDSASGLMRPYTRSSAIEIPVQPRTELDHRFASGGLVGEAGYLCGIGGIGPDTDAPRGGPSSLYGHQGMFLGAKLGYAFR